MLQIFIDFLLKFCFKKRLKTHKLPSKKYLFKNQSLNKQENPLKNSYHHSREVPLFQQPHYQK